LSLLSRAPPTPPPLPYTTLFRSTPAPAATITTPMSGRDAAGELTDPVQRHELDTRGAAGRDARPRRAEDAVEALARGLRQPPLHAGHRPYLATQPDLTQEQRVGGEGAIAHAGDERREHRQIGGRLGQAESARDVDEHVQLPARHATATLQHGEQHREPAVIEAGRDPLRRAEPGLRGERLDLDEERA